jgi:N-acetylneuraminate synthase
MEELSKALDIATRISLQGKEREGVISKFKEQIKDWGIAMPDAELLVWDFGLKNFPAVGLIEIWIANEIQAGYCAKYLFLFDKQTCPMHYHRTKAETFFVVKGEMEIECEGNVQRMSPGATFYVEPGKAHRFTGIGPTLLLEVSMACIVDDNFFENRAIPIGGNYSRDRCQ